MTCIHSSIDQKMDYYRNVRPGFIQYAIIIVMAAIGFVFILAYLGVPPLAGPNGWLRICPEGTVTGFSRKCVWFWDPSLRQPDWYE